MLLEQHLLQLFGNLPYLPKAEITKHLNKFDLMKAYLVSENWGKAVESREKDHVARNETTATHFYMTSKNDRVELSVLWFCSGKTKHLNIDFPVESALESSTEIVENGDRVICHSENFEDFENKILTIFHKIRTWFRVDIRLIEVNLDHGFNFEFLKKLRLEKLGIFELSGDKEDGQIDGEELSDLMNTWNIRSVRIKTETIGKFEGNSKMLNGYYCVFTDSRWITRDMLINKTGPGKFKRCLLTSEDFNAYFKKWKSTKGCFERLDFYTEHELDVEKVLEGLEAKKWNPKERGRMYRGFGYTYIDLADGMDLHRSNGEIGTVRVSADKKVIRFFSWFDKFPLETDKKHFTTMIDQLKPKLEQFAGNPRELARIAKKVEDYEEKLQAVEEEIARENQEIELCIN